MDPGYGYDQHGQGQDVHGDIYGRSVYGNRPVSNCPRGLV